MNVWIKSPLLASVALLGLVPEANTLAGTVPATAAYMAPSSTQWLSNCPPHECGRNSATIEQLSLPALNLDGETFGGFRIVEAQTSSWDFAVSEAGYRLDVNRFGEFIAIHGTKSERVTSLKVHRNDAEKSQYELMFEDAKAVRSWAMGPGCNYQDDHGSDFNADCFEVAYDVFWRKVDEKGTLLSEGPICSRFQNWGFSGPAFKPKKDRVVSHPAMLGNYSVTSWEEPTQKAVLVKGEVYDFNDATVHPKGHSRRLNVACAMSAIGKMKLMGYDPAETRAGWKTTWQQRQATLKMLTARYCAAANDQEFTKNGQAIAFQNQAEWMSPWSKAKLKDSQVEAKWDKDGATCLTLPRSSKWRSADQLDFIRQTCGRNGKPLPVCPNFLPSSGSKSKQRLPTKKRAVAHPKSPIRKGRAQMPVNPSTSIPNLNLNPTLPTIVNSKKAQKAAESSFEGQLSGANEWMTFNRWY